MPAFTISDGVSASLDVTPNPDSAFGKYFKHLSNLSVSGLLSALRSGETLADPALSSASVGVNVLEPVKIGTGQVELDIGGGICGSLGIAIPDGPDPKLFDPDPYDDPIAMSPDDRYVSFGLSAKVTTPVSVAPGSLTFGFSPDATVSFTNYRQFSTKPSAPLAVDAIRQTVAGFAIPCDVDDLEALEPGHIVTISGTGSIKFSATADLLTAVNPLASAALPGPLPSVAIKAGGSISVGADVQLTGEYQVRVMKMDRDHVRLAYYRKSDRAFDVTVSASAGVSAGIGKTDLLSKLISAVSSDAKGDEDAWKKAGVSSSDVENIEAAISASVARTLEVAVSAELGTSREEKAAFSYIADLPALGADARNAVRSALAGDLSALTVDPAQPLPGIVASKDLFENVRQQKYALNINLLGIVNFGWVSKLIASGKTLYEPMTGQLVISDSATALRITTAAANIGYADPEKLRQVAAEKFLITVAYRGARCAGLAASLSTSHSFFDLHQDASPETLRKELDVSTALGLFDPAAADTVINRAGSLGQTLYYAVTEYDSPASSLLFVGGGQVRTVDHYERAGLDAIACLVHDGGADEARLRPTRDASLWKRMKDLGQPGIHTLFPGVSDPVIQAIVGDYSLIRWWADAMSETAIRLLAIEQYLAAHPAADDQDANFQHLRAALADHLGSVAKNTREDFGRPWGLLAMFLASGRSAGCKAMLVAKNLSLQNAKPLASAPEPLELQTT